MTAMRRWLETVDDGWHRDAACKSRDPDVWKLFEPVSEKEPVAWAYSRAEVAIEDFCMSCPVMVQCGLERDRHEYLGVWGGEFSEKRGIIDPMTGMLIRKFPSQIAAGKKDADEAADDVDVEDESELDVVATESGEQYAIAL